MKDKPYLWKKIMITLSLSHGEKLNFQLSLWQVLIDLGVLKGDRVIILSENRPEWQIADLYYYVTGAITVPVYTTSTTADYSHIINHSGKMYDYIFSYEPCLKALPAIESSTDCKNVIKINDDSQSYNNPVNIMQWSNLMKKILMMLGKILRTKIIKIMILKMKLNPFKGKIQRVLYILGTGGNPKGVMLSHGAMLSNCTGAQILLKIY